MRFFRPIMFSLIALALLPSPSVGGWQQTVSDPERDLQKAVKRRDAEPSNPDHWIWVGRRQAYLGRYDEAIATFTQGYERFPNDARFLRHRGHRWITARKFDRAIADLEAAARLIEGTVDQIEPDGQPNAAGIPTSTLHTNIWYHLGLAYFLTGDFRKARHAYERCWQAASNDDMRVAVLDWQYMTLNRLGQRDEAEQLISSVTPDWKIIENHAYHRRLLMYRGLLQPTDLLPELGKTEDSGRPHNSQAAREVELATYGFGVGHWYLMQGNVERAREIFESLVRGPAKAAFGYIAAEVELERLDNHKK